MILKNSGIMFKSCALLSCLILAPLNRLKEIIKSPGLMISDFICCCGGVWPALLLSLSLSAVAVRAELGASGGSTGIVAQEAPSPEERLSQQLLSRLQENVSHLDHNSKCQRNRRAEGTHAHRHHGH